MVYIDKLHSCQPTKRWRYTRACHLFADTIEELHEFANLIGLRRGWFEDKNPPHYDLTVNKRRAALRDGAIEITDRQVVELCRLRRAKC